MKITKKSKFFQKKMFQNIFVLLSGTILAQIITFASMPLITRLFNPSDIGELGTFIAVIEIIIPIAALTYPIAIVLPQKNQDAQNIANVSMLTSIVLSLISIVIISFLILINALDETNLYIYLFLIPIVIVSAGLFQILEQWLIRNKEFKTSAKTSVYHSIIFNGSKIGLGLLYPSAIGLITLQSMNYVIRTVLMYLNASVKVNFSLNRLNLIDLKAVLLRYRDFPVFRAPQMFINAASQSLPIILLLNFFGPVSVGFYSIARLSLNAPVLLLGKAIGDVFYPRFAEASNNKENLYRLLKKATIALFITGILPFGLIFIFGEPIFEIIFGDEWIKSGQYASWLAIWLFFLYINNPAVRALPVLGAQKFHLIFTVFSIVIRTLAIVVSFYLFEDDLVTIATFSIVGAMLNIVLIYLTLKMTKKNR